MALTLAQSAVLCQDKLVKGIIEELVKESPLLKKLPFMELQGNALALNREDVDNMGSVQFYPVGGVWTESTAQFEQATFSLYTLGGDADVPTLIQRSRSNINDQMAAQVKVKTKLMGHAFEYQAVYGVAASSHGFDGVHTLVSDDQQVHMVDSGTSGAALTIAKLDELLDCIRGGRADILMMNRNIRRRLTQYLRTVGSYQTERDDYGNLWEMWGEVPIVINDAITQEESLVDGAYSEPTGGNTSSIFAIRFGEGDGLVGIQNGGIETDVFDKLETKDAMRTRIRWYCGIALYSTLALARLDGITDEAIS